LYCIRSQRRSVIQRFNSITNTKLLILAIVYFGSIRAESDYLAGTAGSGQSASIDGVGASASFNGPSGIAVISQNSALVADWNGNVVRLVNFTDTSTLYVSTVAGTAISGYQDGPATSAMFNNPSAICSSGDQVAYISEFGNLAVRKLDLSSQTVTTLLNNSRLPTASRLRGPRGICLSGQFLYIADVTIIYELDLQSGQLRAVAGSRSQGYFDGIGTRAYFSKITGMAIAPDGLQLVVTDAFVQVVQPIEQTETKLLRGSLRPAVSSDLSPSSPPSSPPSPSFPASCLSSVVRAHPLLNSDNATLRHLVEQTCPHFGPARPPPRPPSPVPGILRALPRSDRKIRPDIVKFDHAHARLTRPRILYLETSQNQTKIGLLLAPDRPGRWLGR
jgi:hypothetical protein